MADRVLVPVDGSQQAEQSIDYAVELYPDATIVLVHVLNPVDGTAHPDSLITYTEEAMEAQRERAESIFEDAEETAGADRTIETEILAGNPSREIVEYAEEHEIDAIVMGSRGRDGAARILLGSVAETVVRRSAVPVTVVR